MLWTWEGEFRGGYDKHTGFGRLGVNNPTGELAVGGLELVGEVGVGHGDGLLPRLAGFGEHFVAHLDGESVV